MSEWQKIETAPTGVRVLLNYTDLEHIECGTKHDDGDGPYFVLFDGDSIICADPTHWMPLPEPPPPSADEVRGIMRSGDNA